MSSAKLDLRYKYYIIDYGFNFFSKNLMLIFRLDTSIYIKYTES